MLATLLPGVRHVRAPLIAGYLWLAGLWLLLSDHLPSRDDAESGLRPIIELIYWLDRLELAVVVSFGAYLIGAVAEELFKLPMRFSLNALDLVRRHSPAHSRSRGVPAKANGMTHAALESVQTVVAERTGSVARRLYDADLDLDQLVSMTFDFPEPEDRDLFDAEHPGNRLKFEALVEELNRRTVRDFPLLATRLMGDQPELFAEVDRNRAEAELRMTLFFPAIFNISVVAFYWSPLVLTLLPGAVALFYQGRLREERGIDLVADALLLGRVEAPALERLSRDADTLIRQKEEARSGRDARA